MLVYTIQCKNGKILVNNHRIQDTTNLLLYIAERYEVDVEHIYTTVEGELHCLISRDDIEYEFTIKKHEYGYYPASKMKRVIAKDVKRITKLMDKFYERYNDSDFVFDLVVK